MKFVKTHTSSDQEDDSTLLEAYFQTGELRSLGELYQRYMPLVYGVCYNYLKSEEESKDAVMQIFEELVLKLRLHRVQNFKSWLHVLARNHCLMLLRKSSRIPTESLPDQFMENEEFVHLNIEETKERELSLMEECMKQLSEEQRSTVAMFYLEEKCYKDIATMTGYDLQKVKSYIQNGKRNLKNCIEKKREE